MLLKYLSENTVNRKIAGIFLLAAPLWSGAEAWKAGFKLKYDFADKLPVDVVLIFMMLALITMGLKILRFHLLYSCSANPIKSPSVPRM